MKLLFEDTWTMDHAAKLEESVLPCLVDGLVHLFILDMAKGTRGRRRNASRQCRSTPYPMLTRKLDVDPSKKKCSNVIQHKKDWEDATCSVCMEFPHNAVLLLCSSHDKGCRPFMCGTSCRYSNCLDQYKKAYTKVTSADHNQPLHDVERDNNLFVDPPVSSWQVEKCGEMAELACPLCRGKIKGWTVVAPAREYLNGKKRTCMEDNCSFVGTYKELRKHVRSEHPSTRPWEVDPAHEQKWKRLEREREREDVISTVTSSMPGSVVFGDYVIERNPYGFDSDDLEEGAFDVNGLGRNTEDIDNNFVNMFLLFHSIGRTFGELRRRGGDSDDDGDDDGTSMVSRLRRQGRALLGRSGRRRRRREANGGRV